KAFSATSETAALETETVSIPVEETATLRSRVTSLMSPETELFDDTAPAQKVMEAAETKEGTSTRKLVSGAMNPEPPPTSPTPIATNVESDEVWDQLNFDDSATAELSSPAQPPVAVPPAPPQPIDRGTRPYVQSFNERTSASVGERQSTQSLDALSTRSMREP